MMRLVGVLLEVKGKRSHHQMLLSQAYIVRNRVQRLGGIASVGTDREGEEAIAVMRRETTVSIFILTEYNINRLGSASEMVRT